MPIRVVSDAIGALQAFLRDGTAEDDAGAPSIALLKIRRSSAAYQCVAHSADHAIRRLRLVGAVVDAAREGADVEHPDPQVIGSAVPAIRALSEVAKKANCDVVLRRRSDSGFDVIAEVSPTSFTAVRDHYTSSGDSQITGELKRVGGATRPRCMIRVAGHSSAIYCDVTESQARTLANYLYSRVVLEGRATWLRATGAILDFKVRRVIDYRVSKFTDVRRRLREAGAARWDAQPNSDAFLTGDSGEAAG
ncbi:MAG: hypothetical protein AB8G96_13730 [Phycisphaerales bacterium]